MPGTSVEERNGGPSQTAQAGPLQVLVFDVEDLRVRMAAPDCLSTLGYSVREQASLTLLDLAPEISSDAWRRLMGPMTTGRTDSCSLRTPLRRRDGGTLPAQLRLQPISEDGKVRVLATIDFFPGGAEAKAGHLLNAALLRSVIETSPDAILTIEPDGRIDSFSSAAEKLFGYTPNEVVGHNVNMLMPEPYRSQHDGYLARYLATGEKRIIGIGRTVMARHKDGRTFPIELAVGEVKSGASHVFTGFVRDISERVAAQARASKLQEELSHVSRLSAMGEIASLIVHELNQPLTAIANFGEAAKRLVEGGNQSQRAAEFMEKSVQQAHRASEMIRRLRGFVSRGASEMEPIAINEVVREAARLALVGAADQHIRTRFDLADGLPEVIADRIQIQQVVVNLIRNGIDAMLEAGLNASGEALLAVETRRDADGAVLISVCDTGPGIPPAVAADLFTPFVTSKKGGMGIGLSVSRSIVEAHGGRIRVEPVPGGGTRFLFTLPPGRR